MIVTHEPDRQRFVTRVSGGLAMLEYLPVGQGLVDFYHTYVPVGNRGRGVASALVEAGVEWAGAQSARVIPSCWYVRAWFGRHPERAHLRAPAE